MKDVTVLIVTFARPDIIKKSIYGFLKNHNYDLRNLKFHLADNDTTGRTGIKNYVNDITQEFNYLDWSFTVECIPGWGNNVNTALKYITTDYVFLMEDDRCAYDTINLVDGVKLMQNCNDVGLVRYDGIAGHKETVWEMSEVRNKNVRLSYMAVNHKLSKRPITYSNQPHLRHTRFTQFYGYYPENVKLGMCERLYALNVKRNPNGPKIAILQDGIQNRFHHLGAGKSRQHTKWDK